MALLETLTIGVGAAVAKSALKLWLRDSEIAAAAATSTVDILTKKLPFGVRRPAQREFDRIAEEVGHSLERFLEAECPDLPENEREAASLAVADALDRAGITDDLLFAKELDPLALERHVLGAVPDGDRDLSGGLYPKILRESCSYVIEITSTLPGFGLRAIQETLHREGEIAALVKQVLETMPRSRGKGAGDESDEAFESQYRQNVARELDRLQLFGITTERVSPRYGLSVAYITLSAARGRQDDDEASDEADDESVISISVDQALAGSERVLIRGDAGSGKTTLLQWLAVQSARDAFDDVLADWNGLVPFFIQLRRWVGEELPRPEQWLTHVAPSIAGAMPQGWVHRQLQTGALVLIDGVDELPDTERGRIRNWLQGLIANAPASRFVVTSRPAAAEEGWLRDEGFDDSQLQSMERQQIEALIDQWHVAAEKQLTDEEILANLELYRESLKQVVRSDRSIRNLATTPLLCAMLCLLNVDRRTRIPKDRMALYRIALETLARREAERETDRAHALELSERQRELTLEQFAYWLIRNDRSDATRAEAEGVFADALPQLADRKKQVVQYLLERSGLLREPVADRIDFIHRTFQEYLAAKRVIAAQDVNVLLSHAHEPTWREVVILATGHASDGCEVILKGLLAQADDLPQHRHYLSLLAVSCLETATAFSQEVQAIIQDRLRVLVPPRNMTEAKALAAAGELAVPHLTNHTPRGARIVAACLRSLSLIGGTAALTAIGRYSQDARQAVTDELLRAKDNFDPYEYARNVLVNIKIIAEIEVNTIGQFLGLSYMKGARKLLICDIKETIELSNMVDFNNLIEMHIHACPALTILDPLSSLSTLRGLGFTQCPGITDLTPLANLAALQKLELADCPGITDLTPLANLTALQELMLFEARGVADLAPLRSLSSLQKLTLGGCPDVIDLVPLADLPALEELTLFGSPSVRDIAPLADLSVLRRLTLADCPKVTDLAPLADLPALQALSLVGTGVTNLASLAQVTSLEEVIVSSESLLRTFPPGLNASIHLGLVHVFRLQRGIPFVMTLARFHEPVVEQQYVRTVIIS